MANGRVLALVVAAAVLLAGVAADDEEWDIAPTLLSHVIKDAGHETITEKALESLPSDMQKAINKKNLIEGVRYNDMPDNDGNNLGVIAFLKRFKKAEKGKDIQNAVARSHVGCNQHWHAMCPVARTTHDHNGTTDEIYLVFENGDVAGLILEQARIWWQSAVDSIRHGKDDSDKYIGHIVHMVQDSYAPAHVLRSGDGPDGCGETVIFQGYTMQHGNDNHGNSDHDPEGHAWKIWRGFKHKNKARRIQLQKCAEKASHRVLMLWAHCEEAIRSQEAARIINACDMRRLIEPILDKEVFKFTRNPEYEAMRAGGSVWMYSGFYEEKDEDTDEKLKAAHVKKRTVQIRYAPLGGDGEPFAECKKDLGKGECIVELHDPEFSLEKSENNDLPAGLLYKDYRDKMGFLAHLCDGQLTFQEQATETKSMKKRKAISDVRKAVDIMKRLQVEVRDRDAQGRDSQSRKQRKEEFDAQTQKMKEALDRRASVSSRVRSE